VNPISDEQFAAVWNAAGSLAAVVEAVCVLAGDRVPRWAVLARGIAARAGGADLIQFADESPARQPPSAIPLARARELAVELMTRHGLTGWEFRFNSNLRRAGVCHYPTRARNGRIELSRHFVVRNAEAEILDTLKHEIAHALVGHGHGHDAVWAARCREIGARPERCYGEHIEMPRGRWRSACPSCRKLFDRHRRPKRLTGWHCQSCGKDRGPLHWREAE
jgi:predicted SprT family Zn-dependent metalloprotease